jgi:ADP-heptose:LPS heptosyltransferase
MTFQVKRRIDYWAGGLLLALMFVPVRFLGVILRRNHTTTRRRGCAVIKLVGTGSLFLAMPSMLEIRRRFPNGRFFLVGTPAVIKVAQEFDWFDEYWVVDDSSLGRLIVSVVRVLWRMASRADHLIDLEVHSRFTTLLTVLSTVRNRIGFVDEIVFWRRGFYTHMTFFNVHGPVYVFYDLLAKWFGVDTVSVSEFHEVFRARVMEMKLPPRTRPASPYVAVGHRCSELGRERRLRPDEWQSMLRPMILAGHEILLLGGPEDSAAADAIIKALGTGRNLCGRLSIAQSARLIDGAAAFYGIDSMLLHFARALAVPSVSVFGPTDPATRLRPLGVRERVAFARLPCSPCIHVNETPPCQGKRTCMALALQELVTSPDRELTVARAESTPPPVGWDVEPGVARVREVSVNSA